GDEKFHSQEKHEHEGEELHDCLDVSFFEKGGEAREGDRAIDHFHDSGAEADQPGPLEAAAGPLVHDGEVDGTYRNRKQEATDKTCDGRQSDRRQVKHEPANQVAAFSDSSSTSSSS